MWPFAKKQVAQKTEKNEWQRNEEMVDAFRQWKPVGSMLEYLGREMVVTGHTNFMSAGYSLLVFPCIKADYADDLGKIHCIEFSAAEVLAMIKNDTNTICASEAKIAPPEFIPQFSAAQYSTNNPIAKGNGKGDDVCR